MTIRIEWFDARTAEVEVKPPNYVPPGGYDPVDILTLFIWGNEGAAITGMKEGLLAFAERVKRAVDEYEEGVFGCPSCGGENLYSPEETTIDYEVDGFEQNPDGSWSPSYTGESITNDEGLEAQTKEVDGKVWFKLYCRSCATEFWYEPDSGKKEVIEG